MKYINPKIGYSKFLPMDQYGRTFKDDEVVVPCGKESCFIMLKTFMNPYWNYTVISTPLSAGTHKFKFTVVDDLENKSTGSETTVTIVQQELPPEDFEIEASGSDVTLTWSHSSLGAPDNYRMYTNGGTGRIDKTTVWDAIGGATTSVTYSGLSSGDWLFVLEAIRSGNESENYYAVGATLPTSNEVPTAPTEDNFQGTNSVIAAKNVSVGKIKVGFYWLYGSEASYFRLYHDSGTGTVDYENFYRFARQEGFYQEYTTPQVYTGKENKEYKFVIRAESPDGVAETNTNEYTVELDGTAPTDVQNLSVTTQE